MSLVQSSSFIKLTVLLYYLDCNYEHLKNVAEDEGTLLKSFPNTGKYLDEGGDIYYQCWQGPLLSWRLTPDDDTPNYMLITNTNK